MCFCPEQYHWAQSEEKGTTAIAIKKSPEQDLLRMPNSILAEAGVARQLFGSAPGTVMSRYLASSGEVTCP
jgi:hypothetical protein